MLNSITLSCIGLPVAVAVSSEGLDVGDGAGDRVAAGEAAIDAAGDAAGPDVGAGVAVGDWVGPPHDASSTAAATIAAAGVIRLGMPSRGVPSAMRST
jgi:hypothetical protein